MNKDKFVMKSIAVIFLLVISLVFVGRSFFVVGSIVKSAIKENEPIKYVKTMIDEKYHTFLDYSAICMINQQAYVDLNGLIANIMGQKQVNGTIKLNNGWLATPRERIAPEELKQDASLVAEIANLAQKQNAYFLYVQSPHKISPYDPQLPLGIYDYHNENIDQYLQALSQYENIPYLDLRKEFYERNINQYDLFFKTDHHWTPECGHLVSNILLDNFPISQAKANTLPGYDFNNYNVQVYPSWHLGSNGQRTGRFYGGIDDFSLITPKFKVDIENLTTGERGDFVETLINMNPLLKKDIASRMTYDIVYGRSATGDFVNHSTSVIDAKVLVFADSMGKVVSPFLMMSFSEVIVYGLMPSADIQKAIEANNPDIVVMLRHPANLLSNIAT